MEAENKKKKTKRGTNMTGILMLIATVNMAALFLAAGYAFATGTLTPKKLNSILLIMREEKESEKRSLTEEERELRSESATLSSSMAAFEDRQLKATFMDKNMLNKLTIVKEEIERDRAVLEKERQEFETSKIAFKEEMDQQAELNGSEDFKQLISTLQASDASLAYQILNQWEEDSNRKRKYQYSDAEVKNILLKLDSEFRAEIANFFFNGEGESKDVKRGTDIFALMAKGQDIK